MKLTLRILQIPVLLIAAVAMGAAFAVLLIAAVAMGAAFAVTFFFQMLGRPLDAEITHNLDL